MGSYSNMHNVLYEPHQGLSVNVMVCQILPVSDIVLHYNVPY